MDPTGLPIPVALAVAAGAGATSFLSPCVAPLVPGYLAFVAPDTPTRRAILVRSCAFITGFSAIFVLLGASAAAASRALSGNRDIAELVSGLLVALIGLALMLDRHPFSAQGTGRGGAAGIVARLRRPASALGAAGVGGAFAIAWSPCIGPVLAAILAMAAGSGSAPLGAALLLAYSLGLGVPFLAAAVALDRIQRRSRTLRAHSRVISRASGALLLVTGVLIASGAFGVATAWLARLAPSWAA